MKKKVNKKIFKYIGSLLILFGVVFFVRFALAQDFGANEVASGLDGSLAGGDPRSIAARIINIALGFLGVIALGIIIYAGFLWMSSAGDEEKIRKARRTLVSAVIGLIIILASWAIATFVLNRLSGAISDNGNNGVCTSGANISCGCGGVMYCQDGAWSGCIGSDCNQGDPGPTTCDSSPNPGCQANSDICASDSYCDDSCTCQPKGEIGDACDLDVNNSTCEADSDLCGEFLSCSSDTCTCFGPPTITNISPLGGFCQEDINKSCNNDSDCVQSCNRNTPNGASGNFVTISGANFGDYVQGLSRVVFSDNVAARNPSEINPVCVNFWSDDQIIVAVPQGLSAGPIRVEREDGSQDISNDSNGPVLPDFVVNNIVRPGLCSVNPNSGQLGEQFDYQGTSLYSGIAYFGNYSSNVQALSSTFTHPAGLSGSASIPNIKTGDSNTFVISQIGDNREASNFIRVKKEADPNDGPYLTSFYPQTGRPGQYVTIYGGDLGGARSSSHVYFQDIEANYDFPAICADSIWSDNQVLVKVPENIGDGSYIIRFDINGQSADSSQLNPNVFKVDNSLPLYPSLCKLEPESGAIASDVKVYGEYFGDEGHQAMVRFYRDKNSSGTIDKENDADSALVTVPQGAVTGPVKVVKNGLEGNELNFAVQSCTSNDNCPGQVCCPTNTYKNGRCEDSLMDCVIDIPTSVFEWNFSTGFNNGDIDDPTESCSTLASYFGDCQTGTSCPNASGVCSPYAGGGKKIVGECDYSCASVSGCEGGLGSSTCTYDNNLNKCVKDGLAGSCSLNRSQTYTIAGVDYDLELSCNSEGKWQTVTETSCPDGFERGQNNICVDQNSSCDICDSGLSCEQIGLEGRCVSNTICPGDAYCEESQDGGIDNCVAFDEASCDCCCRIGNSAQDCCAPLECGGTCGSDQVDDGAGFGVCSGCAAVGTTQEEHDAACNCSTNSGQYCSITPENPQGICTDCSGLASEESCNDHSSVCCYDARQTPSSNDDICRGGSGLEISNNPNHPDYGACAYYNCDSNDPSQCASQTPVKIGYYKNVYDCEDGCQRDEGDVCGQFDGKKDQCTQVMGCCYDYDSDQCNGGKKIDYGPNQGYCAYYSCGDPQANPPQDENACVTNPQVSGDYQDLGICINSCGQNQSGAGQDCVSSSQVDTCNFGACNFPGMACLTDDGSAASGISDCGTCCCNPDVPNACATDENPDLYCQPNVGTCSGAGRGLCCGCQQDSDCGNAALVGCGLTTCCQARPEVEKSEPASGDENVCRNSVVEVTFNSNMDITSLKNNILLLQEMDYSNGPCPADTFVYEINSKSQGVIAKLSSRFINSIRALFRNSSESSQALAKLPESNKLYCASAVNVFAENNGNKTVADISPKKLLAPDANYYLIIKGDEELNSQSGVISADGIGVNGQGLLSGGLYTEGENLSFNNNSYKNSHIVHFKTLSDKESNSGVCAISSIKLRPQSYLFTSVENSLDENDLNANDDSFDSQRDKDKVFSAWAYSSNGQILQPVTGYFWVWDFQILDSSVATIESVGGLSSNKVLVSAQTDRVDAETQLRARVNMENFSSAYASEGPGCICQDDTCSNNCLNAYSAGDGLTTSSNVYIFRCENPWPPIQSDGTWQPWKDNCQNAIGDCTDFSYKFYYCRDTGQPGTYDDLPAIENDAVIRGESSVLSCSSNGEACTSLNSQCGNDENGDGILDGVCVWSVLKESYFFRVKVLPPAEISSASNSGIGGSVTIDWKSKASQVKSYKIYYSQQGREAGSYQEFNLDQSICQISSDEYLCQADVKNLENNQDYVFRVSVVSEGGAESILSNQVSATPSDNTPPLAPTGFNFEDVSSQETVKFNWNSSNEASYYRLYRGVNSGQYGESYDSEEGSTSISLSLSQLNSGNNYFVISAIDASGNESNKSQEVIYSKQ